MLLLLFLVQQQHPGGRQRDFKGRGRDRGGFRGGRDGGRGGRGRGGYGQNGPHYYRQVYRLLILFRVYIYIFHIFKEGRLSAVKLIVKGPSCCDVWAE